MENIKVIKLVTGEDIVCQVLNEVNGYDLKDVITLHQVPAGDGQMQIAVLPFLPYSIKDTTITIKDEHIITTSDPSTDILNQYQNVFGAIAVPKQQDIIV